MIERKSYFPLERKAMLQYSKVIQSRDEWKRKAIQRADENRESRKIKKRYQEKIAELKLQLTVLEPTIKDKKNTRTIGY